MKKNNSTFQATTAIAEISAQLENSGYDIIQLYKPEYKCPHAKITNPTSGNGLQNNPPKEKDARDYTSLLKNVEEFSNFLNAIGFAC